MRSAESDDNKCKVKTTKKTLTCMTEKNAVSDSILFVLQCLQDC